MKRKDSFLRRVKRGFTLLELIVTIAIIGILATLVFSSVSIGRCAAIITGAKKLIKDCRGLITTGTASKTTILGCLTRAQAEIDSVIGNGCLDAKGKIDLQKRINSINQQIDAYKVGGGAEYAAELEAAKLKMP
ncbi:MAG: prepilin-type N-terminal cleavage/methylation domain-containing protein [Verrucomicrobiota bacterium]